MKFSDVGARGEGFLPRSGQNDRANRVVRVELPEGFAELADHRCVQGVEHFGAIEGDDGEAGARVTLDQEGLIRDRIGHELRFLG